MSHRIGPTLNHVPFSAQCILGRFTETTVDGFEAPFGRYKLNRPAYIMELQTRGQDRGLVYNYEQMTTMPASSRICLMSDCSLVRPNNVRSRAVYNLGLFSNSPHLKLFSYMIYISYIYDYSWYVERVIISP